MRNIVRFVIIMLVSGIFFASCSTTIQAVSPAQLNSAVAFIGEQLSEIGYELSGTAEESRNEMIVSGTSYSYYTGYGSAMKNNYWQYQEYSFTDTNDNEVSYTMKYQLKTDSHGQSYIKNLDVTNCSAKRDYNSICGMDGIVKSTISSVKDNPDLRVQVYDETMTILAATGGTVLLTVALLLLLLI